MGCFDNGIHRTSVAIKHNELDQINQNEAETQTVWETERGDKSESWRVAAIIGGESSFSLCLLALVASSWLLVAAAQPQGSVTVN